jgi:periplasmic protein TonB
MPDPARGFAFITSRQSSYLNRIRENLESVWKLPIAPLPAGQVPIHLLQLRRESGYSKAQLGSTCLHALVFGLLIFGVLRPPQKEPPDGLKKRPAVDSFRYLEPNWLRQANDGLLGKRGNSGGRDPLPPSAGELPPPSRMALLPPHLPDGRQHVLAVPVTIADADAPEITRPVNDPGLPWMQAKNNSEGSGEHGVATGRDHGMGDGPGDRVGVGNDAGPFANVVTQVMCKYCPDPLYSDEARKAKLQGQVTMRVLVGADGRAKAVQVTRGIGLGLDENAAHAVRNWQFIPARDAARRPVATWITIETVFRLF